MATTTALALAGQQEEYSREKIELIKRTIAMGATDDELQLFLYTARRTGLDPLARQIHMVKRWNSQAKREVASIQTGIDGYRLIADRTGKLAGISDPEYDSETGPHPGKATVTVKKIVDGSVSEFTASARWEEYVQLKKDAQGNYTIPNAMWGKMPYLMLGKCAEALALRKAFPADLSGVYTFEEMGQADNSKDEAEGHHGTTVSKPAVTQPQRASEKAKATPQTADGSITIEGSITKAKVGKGEGKDATMWVTVGDKLLVAGAAFIHDEMIEGNHLKVEAVESKSDKIGVFYRITKVLECSPVLEGEVVEQDPNANYGVAPVPADGKFDFGLEAAGEQAKPEEEGPKVLEDLKASGAVKPATEVVNKKEQAWKAHVGHDPAVHITYKQGGLLFSIAKERDYTDDETKDLLKKVHGIEHRYLIPKDRFQDVLNTLDPDGDFHEKKE